MLKKKVFNLKSKIETKEWIFKKYSLTLVEEGKADFILDHQNSIGTTTVGFYSGRERLDSNPKIGQASENLARNRVGIIGWKITKEKHQSILAKLTHEDSQWGQARAIIPCAWWRTRALITYWGWLEFEHGVGSSSGCTDLAGFLLTLGLTRTCMEGPTKEPDWRIFVKCEFKKF